MNAVVYPADFAARRPAGGRRMSRQAAAAVGFSLAVHAALFGYLATQKFKAVTVYAPPETIIDVSAEPLPKEPPPPPAKPNPAKSPPPLAFHVPDRVIESPQQQIDPLPAPQDIPKTTLAEPTVFPTANDKPVQIASAPPVQPAKDRIIRNPSWLRRPTGEELGRNYPRRAAELNKSGAATLMCSVAANGTVRDCSVIDEAPKGLGFGDAALASARLFKLNPRTVDGEAVEGAKVRIPLVFSLTD